MSNALAILKQGMPDLPAELAEELDARANITEKVTVPSLSPGGKKWTISVDGKVQVLQKRDAEGDLVPMPVFRGVVIDYQKDRGRSYYVNNYDPNNQAPPDCWSQDGNAPDASVKEPQCETCGACPMAAKGSSRDGTRVACSQWKMLAVLPFDGKAIWDQPLRFKLSPTSIYDGQSPDLQAEGWFAWDNYRDFLRDNGVKNSARIMTKMKFDPQTDYPKVLFSVDRWLTEPEVRQMISLLKTKADEIGTLITRAWTPAGTDGTKVETAEPDAKPAVEKVKEMLQKQPPKPEPKPAAKPMVVVPELEDDGGFVVEDDEGNVKPTKVEAPKKAETKAPPKAVNTQAAVKADVPPDVFNTLANLGINWDD